MAEVGESWVGRLTPRQHEAMWQDVMLAAAWAAANLTALREGKSQPPPGLDLRRISWLLGQGETLKRYTLRQRGPALYLEEDAPAAPASELDAPGSPVADLGAITPHVQFAESKKAEVWVRNPSSRSIRRSSCRPAGACACARITRN